MSYFSDHNQKYNSESLIIVSTTHSGEMYHLDNHNLSHVKSVEVALLPYPEKHGQINQSSKTGTLQKSGMVYERDYEEETREYIEKISSAIQEYIHDHDEKVRHVLCALPAKIKGAFKEEIEKTLHNVHIDNFHYFEGNYKKMNIEKVIDILDQNIDA